MSIVEPPRLIILPEGIIKTESLTFLVNSTALTRAAKSFVVPSPFAPKSVTNTPLVVTFFQYFPFIFLF